MLSVLESIEQPDKPRCLCGRQDVTLDQDVLDFIHLCERSLAHLFQSANFVRVDFTREVDGSVTSLSDLSNDTELIYTELGAAFTEENAFTAIVALLLLL